MKSEIPINEWGLFPRPTRPEIRDALRRIRELAGCGALRAGSVTPGEIAMLEARADELAQWLKPSAAATVAKILASLDAMVARNENEGEAVFAARFAVADLAGLPEFALRAAARDFRCGTKGDGKFRPTTGELRRRALEVAREAEAELAQICALRFDRLPAPTKPISEEKRKALADMLRAAARISIG